MRWPFPPPRRRDLLGVLIAAALVAAAIFFQLGFSPILHSNWGFGPDWSCSYPGKGEPVCIKKIPPPAKADHPNPPA